MDHSDYQPEPSVDGSPVRPQDFHDCIDTFPLESHADGSVGTSCPNGGSGSGVQEGCEGEEDAQDAHVEFETRVKSGPPEPTQQDRDHHESTGHAIFRSWCTSCVCGRGRADPHA